MVKLRVREMAQKQGLNQRQLAERSGVSAQLINRYWNYQMQRVDLDALAKLAKTLGCKLGDLFEEQEEVA
jgi:transcriptional regulator with XRE-family HTH domain